MSIQYGTLAATYSIVAHDPATGQLGVAVQTHQMGVGRVVPWVMPGFGAVATQSLSNISYGPNGLAMLVEGISPSEVVNKLTSADDNAHYRQLAVINARGQTAAFTGQKCIRFASHYVGNGYSVQANMMTRDGVIVAMSRAYEKSTGDLAGRLMETLKAAQAAGGDIRGMQSAALVIAPSGDETLSYPVWERVYDLRVDEHEEPLAELERMVRLRRASLLSDEGDDALLDGNKDKALRLYLAARQQAPELEELAFWQVVSLADEGMDIPVAVEIFNDVFTDNPLRSEWLDLIARLEEVELIKREGLSMELVKAIRAAS